MLIEQQDEDIEQAMVNHYRNNKDSLEKLEKFVCTHLSKACDGVTKDKKSKTKQVNVALYLVYGLRFHPAKL